MLYLHLEFRNSNWHPDVFLAKLSFGHFHIFVARIFRLFDYSFLFRTIDICLVFISFSIIFSSLSIFSTSRHTSLFALPLERICVDSKVSCSSYSVPCFSIILTECNQDVEPILGDVANIASYGERIVPWYNGKYGDEHDFPLTERILSYCSIFFCFIILKRSCKHIFDILVSSFNWTLTLRMPWLTVNCF